MKSIHRKSLGQLGESIAASFLEAHGYSIVKRNIRTPYGEVDIIAVWEEEVVFVEVKTRASAALGPPEISITPRKEQHMRDSAMYYIQQHPEITADWRIDLITVQIKGENFPPIIDHFENVVQ